jgi:hypothetical protein
VLKSHKDLTEGDVYIFQNEQVRYSLGAATAQYSDELQSQDRHVFTAWPIDPSKSRSAFLTSAQVDMLIESKGLTGPL